VFVNLPKRLLFERRGLLPDALGSCGEERAARRERTPPPSSSIGQLEERLRHTARRQKKSSQALAMPLRHTTNPEEQGPAIVDLFQQLMWPFGEPRPAIYFDPRTAAKKSTVSCTPSAW
jgi:hypothetical protein